MQKQNSTKNKIFNTCVGLFSERGYANVKTREIARAAGLSSEGALYYHYPSKESILNDILDTFRIRASAYIIPPARIDTLIGKETPEQLLRRFVQVFHKDEAELMTRCFRIAVMEQPINPFAREIIDEYPHRQTAESVEYVLTQMQKRGEVPRYDPKEVSCIWTSSIYGQAVQHINSRAGKAQAAAGPGDGMDEYQKLGDALVTMSLTGRLTT